MGCELCRHYFECLTRSEVCIWNPISELARTRAVEVITDENFVWTLICLLIARDDDEETTLSWNTFHEVLMDNEATKVPHYN